VKRRVGGKARRDLDDAANGSDAMEPTPIELARVASAHWGGGSHGAALPDTVLDDYLEDLT